MKQNKNQTDKMMKSATVYLICCIISVAAQTNVMILPDGTMGKKKRYKTQQERTYTDFDFPFFLNKVTKLRLTISSATNITS